MTPGTLGIDKPAIGAVTSADGTRIGYRTLGTGPGLVLLHGGMQSSYNLMRLAEHLAGAFTLYVPDRRGRGLSGPTGPVYGLERAVEDLEALLRSSGARQVFAASVGGIVALQAALRPGLIDKLAVYEPPLVVVGSAPAAWRARYDQEVAAGRLAAAFVTHGRGVEASPLFT
jgi:pimeloyl-ACP methyl ester carboxylesterase